MAGTRRNYPTILNIEEKTVSWKTFHVVEAGRTNGAHHTIVQELERMGQTQEISPEECDYLLVFCPIVSRVGTDIGEALDDVPAGKPVILVVMHHTFDPNHVVPESRRQVQNPNVRLTVDCLFYEDKLLHCNLNEIMRGEVRKFFGVSISQTSWWQYCFCFCLFIFNVWQKVRRCCKKAPEWIVVLTGWLVMTVLNLVLFIPKRIMTGNKNQNLAQEQRKKGGLSD